LYSITGPILVVSCTHLSVIEKGISGWAWICTSTLVYVHEKFS